MNKLNYALIILVVVLSGSLIYQTQDAKASTLASVQSSEALTETPKGWKVIEERQFQFKAIVPANITGGGSCVRPMEFHKASDGTMGRFGDPKIPVWDWVGANSVFMGAYSDCPGIVQHDGASGININIEPNIETVKELQSAIKQTSAGLCKLEVKSKGQWDITSAQPSVNEWAPRKCWVHDAVKEKRGTLEGFYNSESKTFVYWIREKNFYSPEDPEAYKKFRIEKLDI